MDKLEGFQIVKEARAMLRSMPAREVNEATAREYRKTFDFLKNENISPEENTSCKNTYYKRRAAINYICTKFLKEALTEQDRAQKQGDWKEWCRQLDIIQDCLHYLKKFPQQKEMGEGLKKGNVIVFGMHLPPI